MTSTDHLTKINAIAMANSSDSAYMHGEAFFPFSLSVIEMLWARNENNKYILIAL